MRVVLIVQSRFGSSRLPGKALKPIAGRPMLAHVLERARAVRAVDEVVLATSDRPADDLLAQLGAAIGVAVWRGPEADVLGRFCDAAYAYGADVVMRVTGDCPLLAPDVCARVLQTYLAEPYWDYVSNDVTVSGYPDGTDCEVFSMALLRRAAGAVQPHASWVHGDREHVTTWMRRTAPQRIVRYEGGDYGWLKLSVDTARDLAVVQRLYAYLPANDYTLAATLAALAKANDVVVGIDGAR